MSIGTTIIEQLKRRKLSQSWLAKRAGIKRVTFALKVKKERFTAIELITISKILDLDLNLFKTAVPEVDSVTDAIDFFTD
jgi:hypothetical protein